jgi:ATP-dependent DNA helicase RecG
MWLARRSSPHWPRCRRSKAASRSRHGAHRALASSFRKLQAWLGGIGIEIVWLSGSLPAKQRRKAQEALASGSASFAVGTHALFQEGVAMPHLGLAIVDEQHRFGVAQRRALRDKGRVEAHQLMMSATPIPRTLAMTFYADLDVSVLDEMPPGRTPDDTARQPETTRRDRRLDRQGLPREPAGLLGVLIEESEARTVTAVALHDELTRAFESSPAIRVSLLHGR